MPSLGESLTNVRQQLQRAFEPEQAGVLAEVLGDILALQHRYFDEMSGLRGEVRQLAEAQTRTEKRVEQLAKAQEQLAQAQERLAQAQERTEQRVEQLAQAQARTERAVQLLARQVGGLSEKLGGSLEDLAIETVPAVLAEAWDLAEIECGRDVISIDGEQHELDFVARGRLPAGGALAVLGEVKARLTAREVEEFLARAQRLAPALVPAEVRVMFFGFQCNLEARALIRAAGAYMVFSNGRVL
jgi:hypothetical protein